MIVIAAASVALMLLYGRQPRAEDILAAYNSPRRTPDQKITIEYPFDQTLFPPELPAPTFRWKDNHPRSNVWLVSIIVQNSPQPLNAIATKPSWTPTAAQWDLIKQQSSEMDAQVTILGVSRWFGRNITSAGEIAFRTSKDPVGAPLFYREVNLPFIDAVKDPSLIRWRFGPISAVNPPIVLTNLPVCGNCHSFCRTGKTLAMDVDYANSKGSYVITKVHEQMLLATSDIITWNDYRKEDGEQTFGLLSQISPDGRYVISTVKDKSVFVPMPDLAFSQLFFPIKGILCVYDSQTREFYALPGADDPNFVQSNPSWSPDGKFVVFARAKTYDLKDTAGMGKVLLTREECREFTEEGKPFLFDLYRLPFNDGKGGTAEPIDGASNNGMSNYFGRYSPDGKWLVFCRAKSYMLLQRDSELFIIPPEGGTPRRLQCNTAHMNSWHSWSPNGKWLVFSSKANSPYTQLMLTHIDEHGNSTPPVSLAHMTDPDHAANIPEFVNTSPTAIRKIQEEFLDDYSFVRAGNEFFKAGDTDNAIKQYQKALQLNPNNAVAHNQLGFLLYQAKNMHKEGLAHAFKAVELDPDDPRTHYNLGIALVHQRQFDQAIAHLLQTLRRMPQSIDKQYDLARLHCQLGTAYLYKEQFDQARVHLTKAMNLDPNNANPIYNLAVVCAAQGQINETVKLYSTAIALKPQIDTSPMLHYLLSMNYAAARQFPQALASAQRALMMAQSSGDTRLSQEIRQSISVYQSAAGGPNPSKP